MHAIVGAALKQRVLMLILSLALIAGGLFAYKQLNIEAYPDPVPPLVDIVTQNPGQSSEEIERYITIPIEIQMAVLGTIDRELCPLEQDRQVGRFLKFKNEDTIGDSVRKSGGDEHRIAGANNARLQCAEKCSTIALSNPITDLAQTHLILESDADLSTFRGIKYVPGLGLAVGETEMSLRERAIGMQMHRQALIEIEQLHQHLSTGAVAS
jgi:hypothetical protein